MLIVYSEFNCRSDDDDMSISSQVNDNVHFRKDRMREYSRNKPSTEL